MKSRIVIASALAAVMTASALGTTALATTTDNKTAASSQSSSAQKTERHGKPEKVAEPENAIGKDKAETAALKSAGVSESKVDKVKTFVIKLDDGTVVYRVSFKYGEKYYAYKINATTGKVAEKKVQTAEEHEASKKEHGGHGMGKHEKSNSSTKNKTS